MDEVQKKIVSASRPQSCVSESPTVVCQRVVHSRVSASRPQSCVSESPTVVCQRVAHIRVSASRPLSCVSESPTVVCQRVAHSRRRPVVLKIVFARTMYGKLKLEVCALLGCYAPLVGSCVPTFRDILSVPYSRVKKSEFLDP